MDSLLVLLSLIAFAAARIPEGYILDVSPKCTTGKTDATVTITSDLNVKAVYYCSGKKFTKTINEKRTKSVFKIHYADKKDKKCFFKIPSSKANVYMITLEVFWGEPGASAKHHVHTQKEIYKIVCTTGGKQTVTSKGLSIGKRPFAPEQKGENKGKTSSAKMSLVLYDVLDKSLDAKTVQIGKKVYLKGVSAGSKAIVPVDCDATSDDKKSYQILRGGCGDGIVFKTDAGFTAKGKETTSPIFGFFHFPRAKKVTFSCTFIECTGVECSLKKNSCVSRKRRSIEDPQASDIIEQKEAIPRLRQVSTDYMTSTDDSNSFPGKVLIVYSSPPSAAAPTIIKGTEDRKCTTIIFAILSCFTAVSLIVSLYVCTKQGRYRSELSNVKA